MHLNREPSGRGRAGQRTLDRQIVYVIRKAVDGEAPGQKQWLIHRWYISIRDEEHSLSKHAIALWHGDVRVEVIRGSVSAHANIQEARNEIPPSRQRIGVEDNEGTRVETWA